MVKKTSLKNLMMLVLSVSLVIGVVLTSACAGKQVDTPNQETPTQIIKDITTREASTLMQENQGNPDFVIIDVRTKEEFVDGYIENAYNIDFYPETFWDELDNLDKDKNYLIYCRSGNRSGKALNVMAELNFKEVYNMLGGILSWEAEGLPIIK